MTTQTPSQREALRLAALDRYALLDTPPEEGFDDLTRLAAQICGTPIALITLLDDRRQWFKSKIGTDIGQMPRAISFCRFALDSPDLLLVPDTLPDPRFAENPLVTGEPFVRFYAGAPLLTPDGDILGTLCVADTRPRTLCPEQQSALQTLSRQVMAQMELRRRLADLERAETAHGQDAETLRRNEEQYRLLFAVNPNPMWVFDQRTLRILAVNAAAVAGYGYTRDEFLRLTIRELRPKERIPEMEAALRRLPPQTSYAGIHQHRRKGGGLLWVDVTSHPLVFEGRDCRMVTALNVTDRHEAEEALRQKNALLQAVTEGISDALYVKDLAGRYLLINTAGAHMIGRPIPEILGRDDTELFPPQTAQQMRANDQRILAAGQTESYEGVETDGRTFLSSKGVYRDARGEAAGVFGLSHDITALRQVDQARHEAEEKYRSIFENAVEGIFQSIPGGGFRSANPALARMLGYDSPEDLLAAINDVGTQVYAHPQERPEMQRLFESREMVSGHEMQVQRRDGTTFWASLSARAVRDPQTGRIQYIEGSAVDVTARRQAEERLRQLADVVEYSSEAIISKTPDDTILSWNSGAERLYGYRADEAIGRRFGEIVPPTVPGAAPSLLARLLAGEHVSRVETARLDRWGRRVDITVSISAIRDAEGRIRAISSIATDITARKRTEQALQAVSERLRLVVGSTPLVLFALDEHGVFTLSEGKGLEKLGLKPGEVVGQSVWDLYRDAPSLLESVRRAYAGESLGAVEQVGALSYDSHYAPLQDESARVVGVLGIASDITERRAAELALRESESLFRSAFDDAPIGMTLCDMEGRYVQVNPAFCRLIGYSQSELLQCRFQTITHPEDMARDVDIYQKMQTGSVNGYTLEKRYFHKAGHIVWVQISVSLVRDGQGKPLYSISQIQDITERRALEDERERLLRQTEGLLAEALERADRDPLTGLLNHRAFHKRLDEECEYARQTGAQVSIVMVDLDNFKFFNDAYGHLAGDEVLRRIASVLSACLRPGDTLARFGGDEFALLLPGLDEEEASVLVQQTRGCMADAGYRPAESEILIPLTLSAGIAAWPQDGLTRLEAVERADERLRLNKTGAEDMQADQIRTQMGRSLEGFTMLDALVTAVDNKDRYTRRHSDDVLTYSLQIAQELGLDAKTQETVAVAALLHDVGKISIPDRILRKPGKLSEEEFAAIRQHPMMGAIIVGAVPGLEGTLDAVRHHHERWDGGGYPFGLHGEETPLIARLMAVADAFSAMTTDRPYRKGMPHEKALRILDKGAGAQWDPACVEAFLRARSAA